MSIIGGLDIHRKQLTFDYVETETGRVERGRIAPADRERLADWLTRFDTATPVAFALEGCTGWRDVVEEMGKAGVRPHPVRTWPSRPTPPRSADPRGTPRPTS